MRAESQLRLPQGAGSEEITVSQNLIIIGANGSGKTRLGTWIEFESQQRNKVHRISAQKSLSMPDTSSPMSLQKAESTLLYGHEKGDEKSAVDYKRGHRWGSRPAIMLLSDFERLMVYLFSEHYEQSSQYLQAARASDDRVIPPETKIDIAKKIWEEILPHRELIIGGGTVKTCVKGSPDKSYNASEMSDGERVIFYMIGQCLAAPNDGIIVIDEPELHLHKSIQVPLWNEIEKYRSDCLFVYITHDVDFSASKESSVKVWLKSYDGTHWEWETIEQIEGMPENLLIEVIGSRKPVVFVEGENGSYDVALYRALLGGFLVIPVGSCSRVIQSVKALREHTQLHHLQIYGVIDRDRRVDEELNWLESVGVFALDVAEVENLFCTPEILQLIAKKLEREPVEVVKKAELFILSKLTDELETQISLRCASEIKFKLNLFNEKAKGLVELQSALDNLTATINAPKLYAESEKSFKSVIEANDYKAALRLYNRKSLASQIGGIMGFKSSELPEYVVRLAKGSAAAEIADALRPYFGKFSVNIA